MSHIHRFRSYVITELVDTKELAKVLGADHSSIDPRAAILHRVGEGYMFVFNFGSLVFWNVPDQDQRSKLASLIGIPGLQLDGMFSDEFSVIENQSKPQVEFNRLLIDTLSPERAEVIAGTLAQSCTMEYYETITEDSWTQVDEFIARLAKRGKLPPLPNILNKKVGASLGLRSKVVRVLHLLDRPDLIWDDRLMDSLYSDLRAMFDLQERFQALEYKLQLIQQSWELLVDTSRDQRLYWLEAAIVLLIVFEILITLLEKLSNSA